MKIQSEFPFDGYNAYIVVNPEGRRSVCLVNKTNYKDRTTISYAKYLMCVEVGYVLPREVHVDHIDEDKTNDSIENLQIISQGDNCEKHVVLSGKTRQMVEMICPECGDVFSRERNKTHLVKSGRASFCSRKCAYSFSKRGVSLSEMSRIGGVQLVREYRR